MIYNLILEKIKKKKLFALLIDPENSSKESIEETCKFVNNDFVDIILVGGSLVSDFLDQIILDIKKNCDIPIVIFPGNLLQISDKADAILFLSLISGRNPDLLFGNHVIAAPLIRKKNIETISTGYILVEGGKTSSVEYMSNTKPIPADKHDIIVATAIAGEMLGHKMIYLESGSGAINSADASLISDIRKNISIPLMVGGGIKDKANMERAYNAGADIVVVGNIIEQYPDRLSSFKL